MVRSLHFLSLLVFFAGSFDVDAAAQPTLAPGDGVYESGDWKYQFIAFGRGTPEERAAGKLSFKGKEVVGLPFARIRTGLGEFQWAGYECPESRWGWYRIDPEKKYARWVRVRIDPSRRGTVWRTIPE